jgi:hypothetical protein
MIKIIPHYLYDFNFFVFAKIILAKYFRLSIKLNSVILSVSERSHNFENMRFLRVALRMTRSKVTLS